MTGLRLIRSEAVDGPFAMAADMALLEAGIPAIRLYTWAPLFLSVGHFQDMSATLALPFLARHGILPVRRPTGGKGVLHKSDLSYSVTLPEGFAGKRYADTIRLITGSISFGLRLLGCDSYLNEDRDSGPNPSPSCFARATAHEIMAGGKKIAGCAHLTRGGRFLEQGSILLGLDRTLLAGCFLSGDGPDAAPGSAMTCLREQTGRVHAAAEVMDAVETGFREHAGWILERGELTAAETIRAGELVREKYGLG
jgi:lipoyl(octanoyl) transferase